MMYVFSDNQCSNLFLPTHLWQEKMQPHPPPERVQVAGSESAAEATARCGNKQWEARNFPWIPKNKKYMHMYVYNYIYTVYI